MHVCPRRFQICLGECAHGSYSIFSAVCPLAILSWAKKHPMFFSLLVHDKNLKKIPGRTGQYEFFLGKKMKLFH